MKSSVKVPVILGFLLAAGSAMAAEECGTVETLVLDDANGPARNESPMAFASLSGSRTQIHITNPLMIPVLATAKAAGGKVCITTAVRKSFMEPDVRYSTRLRML